MTKAALASLVALLALTACGGGGSTPAPSSPQAGSPHAQASSSPAPASTAQLGVGTLVIVIAQPPAPSPSPSPSSSPSSSTSSSSSSSRKPQYVSPGAYAVGIAINGSSPTYSDVYAGSTNCVTGNSVRTCTISVAAPIGSDTFAITFYDGVNGTGKLLGQGTGTTTVALGTPFTVTIPISVVVGSASNPIVTYTTGSSFTPGTAGTATLSFTLADPDGYTIPATSTTTFVSPLTLSSSDPNVTVTPTSWTGIPQTLTLSYNGSTSVAGTVTITLAAGSTTLTTVPIAFVEMVTTFAGTGSDGSANGPVTSASFFSPVGVAVDSGGNVYVGDSTNNAIRKITAGVVSTLAGIPGSNGFMDGPGGSALFSEPQGVAVDSAGNVYVADTNNNAIRKVTSAGVVSTLAGTGAAGFANGPGTSATFSSPVSVAVDTAGNVYVADTGNDAIRMVTPAGVVSTLAGTGSYGFNNGPGTSATFHIPDGVAVDSSGNVYVADYGNDAIRKITAGVVSTLAGTGSQGFSNGPGSSATFFYPYAVAVDSGGYVYVGDRGNAAIRKITPAGIVSTLAGTGTAGFTNGPATSATFDYPAGVAVDSSGNVYVADYFNDVIREIAP